MNPSYRTGDLILRGEFGVNNISERSPQGPKTAVVCAGFAVCSDFGPVSTREPSRNGGIYQDLGNSYREGDEPFERIREITIDELTAGAFAVGAEIGPAEKPIVLTYEAQRLPAPGE
jgi:hypothetical protein